jgi:predicted N-acetyltransferase YhbS
MPADISVEPLLEADLQQADQVMREAFGARVGVAAEDVFRDASLVVPRFRLHPDGAVVARDEDGILGSALAMRWGRLGVFGPLSVRPDRWGRGLGRALLEATLDRMAAWDLDHAGLFTWSNSPAHLALYRAAGFWPRFLSLLLAKPVTAKAAGPVSTVAGLAEGERASAVAACAELAGAVWDGLDLSRDARGVADHGFGDTVLLEEGDGLAGFAVCHTGPGSEAGSGHCLVKFAAVRPGPGAADRFDRLLTACDAFAAGAGAFRVLAAVDAGRLNACRHLLAHGFEVSLPGVSLHRDGKPAYDGPDAWVADDWR